MVDIIEECEQQTSHTTNKSASEGKTTKSASGGNATTSISKQSSEHQLYHTRTPSGHISSHSSESEQRFKDGRAFLIERIDSDTECWFESQKGCCGE